MKMIIILGSSRSVGDTKNKVDSLVDLCGCDVIDLNDYTIGYYDYEHKNEADDFLGLMHSIIPKYDVFIFATPVYWYAMSGVMKVFFDRITDLLDMETELGRQLRSKSMAVLSCSIGNHLDDHFWMPFKETAAYLGMNYLGNIHTLADNDEVENLKEFLQDILQKLT